MKKAGKIQWHSQKSLEEVAYLWHNNNAISICELSRLFPKVRTKGDVMDKKSFDTMKNGYNRYQVDDYISLLSNENEELKKKQTVLLKQVEEMEKELAEKQQEYNKVMENLAIREKAAGEMARIAMKEANMVVDTAQKNADAIVKESLIMARGILLDIARLGNEANELKGSMKDELRQLEAALDEFETPNIPNMDLLKKEL